LGAASGVMRCLSASTAASCFLLLCGVTLLALLLRCLGSASGVCCCCDCCLRRGLARKAGTAAGACLPGLLPSFDFTMSSKIFGSTATEQRQVRLENS
jgi:hypothetical protein